MSGLSLDMEQFLIAAADKIPNLSGMKFNSADMYEFQRCLRVNNRQFDIPFGVDEFLPAGPPAAPSARWAVPITTRRRSIIV